MSLIYGFPSDGVVTINRVILKPQYTVDELQERVAMMCENVKTYHSETASSAEWWSLTVGRFRTKARPSASRSTVLSRAGGADHHFLEELCRARAVAPFRHLPAAVQAGAGTVRERQRGVAYDMLWSGKAYDEAEAKAAREAKARYGGLSRSVAIPPNPAPRRGVFLAVAGSTPEANGWAD